MADSGGYIDLGQYVDGRPLDWINGEGLTPEGERAIEAGAHFVATWHLANFCRAPLRIEDWPEVFIADEVRAL